MAAYDGMVGVQFFRRARRAFEALVPRYGIRFCSAADIGCGTGLFARYLNRCWEVPVYAVDKSPEMLAVARRRCGGPGICFLQQDLRQLYLPEPVDLVTANFDTMNHLVTLPDLRQAFRRVAENLRPGGHFYFDCVTPCRPLGGLRAFRRTYCSARRWMEQRIHWEPARRLISIQLTHRRSGCASPAMEQHFERAYAPDDVARGLFDAGFMIRGVHDEATLRFPRFCPARMIVVARKAGGYYGSHHRSVTL